MAQSLSMTIGELIFFPRLRKGVIHIIQHNFVLFKQSLLVNFFWIGVEPLIYLYAIGIGVGSLISDVQGIKYFEFFFPGLIAVTAMIVTSYETTHGTYNRAYNDRTFSALFLTPITSHDLFLGEILWAVVKGMLSVSTILCVLFLMNKIGSQEVAMLFACATISCWFFAALGMTVNSLSKNSEFFILYQAGFLIPMAMLGGAYFPVSYLPDWARYLCKILPLPESIELMRAVTNHTFSTDFYVGIGYFLLLSFLLTNIALVRMGKRLDTML